MIYSVARHIKNLQISHSTINITVLGRRGGAYTDGFTVCSSIKGSCCLYQQRDQEREFR